MSQPRGWGVTAGIGLLVASALVVIVGFGVLLSAHERETAAQRSFARTIADRTVQLVRVVRATPQADRRDLVKQARSPDFEVHIAPAPPPKAPGWRRGDEIEAAALAAMPRQLASEAVVAVVPGHAGPPPKKRSEPFWPRRSFSLVIGLPLGDGTWLVAIGWSHPVTNLPGARAMVTIGLAVLAVVLVALLVARRMTRPLRLMAAAADRLAADIDAPPLPDGGSVEMRRAAAAFNHMQERLRRVLDDRTLMLAALSHDLRTVITRLRLRAEEIDDAEQRGKALDDLADMETMLKEGLDFARGEATREVRQKVDVAALVKSLADDEADAGHAVSYAGPERLVLACRPTALRRALANLIGNAVRYGGGAEVSLEQHGSDVVIEIADRGPGIPDAAKEAMFRPFMRGEPSRNRATGGTGLGLAVARSILRAHGGEVTLHDRQGGGLVARAVMPTVEPT